MHPRRSLGPARVPGTKARQGGPQTPSTSVAGREGRKSAQRCRPRHKAQRKGTGKTRRQRTKAQGTRRQRTKAQGTRRRHATRGRHTRTPHADATRGRYTRTLHAEAGRRVSRFGQHDRGHVLGGRQHARRWRRHWRRWSRVPRLSASSSRAVLCSTSARPTTEGTRAPGP